MSKKKLNKPMPDQGVASARARRKDGGTRETVESIAIAFALAFLFKTFQAEAYVIPTGSMAPTLHGRHKELICPSCHFNFQIGASTELDDSTGYLHPGRRIDKTLCPNCRREVDAFDAPVFNGDRIIVNKQVTEYRRFDVVVFKNPEEGHVNYIKRLVGLPGETIRIRQGNLWMKRGDNNRWQTLRKDDPEIQRDTQLLVYDDRYPAHDLLDAGFPERWAPSTQSADGPPSATVWLDSANAWAPNPEAREYTADATGDEWQWLRYRHLIPSAEDWDDANDGRPIQSPRASLVSDYCAFNVANVGSVHRGNWQDRFMSDAYWVGDLTLNCTLDIVGTSENSAVRLELVEGPDTFGCEIDPVSGAIQMTRVNFRTDRDGERPEVLVTALSDIQGPGVYEVSFANVDNRLLLWIDGGLLEFDSPVLIDQNFVDALTTRPDVADTAPCGIAVRNAQVKVRDLLVQRDLYYRNDAYQFSPEEGFTSNSIDPVTRSQEVSSPSALHRKLRDPEAWADHYVDQANTAHSLYGRYSEYRLADDEYLMFGDNSPRSKDSRLFDYYNRPRWGVDGHRYAVKEKDLIGNALFVFWPHGVPFLNDGQGFTITNHKERSQNGRGAAVRINYPSYRFPFYPNVSRMKKIR
jgi:signal peptidase I